jgi:predicted GIY-YIG superfamily endonuclease
LLGEVEDFNYLYGMKKCSKCQETKELIEFNKRIRSKDGLNPCCKICDSQRAKNWGLNNPDKKKQQNKNYYQNYTDKCKASIKSWSYRISGVYCIFENNKCLYVGRSKGISKRIAQHKCFINKPFTAPKQNKQLYYNLQQHSNLEFKIIEETPNHKEREQYWINELKPKYNAQ